MRVLMMGCGRLGAQVGLALAARGHYVWAARRRAGLIPRPLCPLKVKLEEGRGLDALPRHLDLAVYCIAPASADAAGYAEAYRDGLMRFLDALPDDPALLFVSSTGVYHQSGHEWVSEQSLTRPQRFSGRYLLQAEQLVAASRFAATSVRFSGIYGPEPGRLLKRVRAGLAYPPSPLHYGNRIHFADAAGALVHLANRALRGDALESCYLASDSEPAPRHEVADWLRERCGAVAPDAAPPQSGEDAGRHAAGSKRCCNRRLLDSGYEFIHPNYRSGYEAVLASG